MEQLDGYTRQRRRLETEPGVVTEFWFLHPKGDGPFSLGITPHGHENTDTYVGIRHDDRSKDRVQHEDQDVGVQAVQRGFLTITPAARGIGFMIADISDICGEDCRCHSWLALIA